ncbi:hypothetical protein EV686_1041, partial [Paracandidimonas soli]
MTTPLLSSCPEIVGTLASQVRHDSCPQSSMIRGV